MGLSKEALDILVCPRCKGELEHIEETGRELLVCPVCKLAYPVEDDIPIMLVDRAHTWEPPAAVS